MAPETPPGGLDPRNPQFIGCGLGYGCLRRREPGDLIGHRDGGRSNSLRFEQLHDIADRGNPEAEA